MTVHLADEVGKAGGWGARGSERGVVLPTDTLCERALGMFLEKNKLFNPD